MIASLLTKKISTFLLSKSFLIIVNKIEGIVKVFDIILFILFRFISSLANKVFNYAALIFFHYLFIK